MSDKRRESRRCRRAECRIAGAAATPALGAGPGGSLRQRATVIQQKTGRPVPFEIIDFTRDGFVAWLKLRGELSDDWLFPNRSQPGDHISTRQYARLVGS